MARPPFKLEWTAYEYEHKERGSDWFWAVGIISVSLAVASIIFGNIIFGILILVGAFTLSLYAKRSPEEISVLIDEEGVTRNKIRYLYESLASFWIDLDHPHKKIIFRSKKMLMPLIIIPLADDVDSERLHRILSRQIEEEYHSLPIVEKILEYLGF